MNNSQAALIAAAAFHSGQQASAADVLSTASTFETHLKRADVSEAMDEGAADLQDRTIIYSGVRRD